MNKQKKIYTSVSVFVFIIICALVQTSSAQKPTPTPTGKEDIQKYEAERKKNEERAKLNALAKDFIDRKMAETYKNCSDSFRYALWRKNLLQFKNLGWRINPIRVLQPTELEIVNNSEVEWEGKVYLQSSTELKSIYYKEYDKEKGNWERPFLPFDYGFDFPLASVAKRKGADFQFSASMEEVNCDLVTATKETILNVIDPELAKANQNLAEAISLAETLRDRIFSKCSDGFWHFTFNDFRYGGLGAPLAQYRFKKLNVVVKGGSNKFYIGFAADDVSIYYPNSFEDRKGNMIRAGWHQWEGKEATIPYLSKINIYYTPNLFKKEAKWWFPRGSWNNQDKEISEGMPLIHSDLEYAKDYQISPCVP